MITDDRKLQAIVLRKQGLSIKQIACQLNSAQSSASLWCKEVALTTEQKRKLQLNTHSQETIEKRRQSRLASEKIKRDKVINAASESIGKLDGQALKLIVAALYWGEGAKNSGIVQFTNGDPRMIELVLFFFRNHCEVHESKLRAYIHIHNGLNVVEAEKYWQKITKISPSQFYKTYNKKNNSSKNTRSSLPFGVCDIYVMDASLFYKIRGWTEGIYLAISDRNGTI